MEVVQTEIPDVLLIKPRVFEDERGFFMETFNENKNERSWNLSYFCTR